MNIDRVIKATDYDISSIVAYAISHGIDITPAEEKDWKMLLNAFKCIGLDESSFVACSKLHGTPDTASRKAWRYARRQYYTQEDAASKILYWASQAGIKLWDFLSDDKQSEWIRAKRESESRRQEKILGEVKSILRRDSNPPDEVKTEPTTAEPKEYLYKSMLRQSESLLEQTTLFRFMLNEFGEECKASFVAYRVGGCRWEATAQGLASAFPLMDADGNLCDFQLSPFDISGRGLRYPAPPGKTKGDKKINYALSRMNRSKHRAKWSFFGEHLLRERPTAPVCIVEAPKTAIICNIVYPERVWLACLSLQWLNSAVSCEPLRNRQIELYPDRDGFALWKAKATELANSGFNVSVSEVVERHPGEPNDDIADIVLRYRHGEQAPPREQRPNVPPDRYEAQKAFEEILKCNPVIAEFAKRFELEAVSVNPFNPDAV